MAELKELEVSALKPHPKNPRLTLREDVVEGIKGRLDGHMNPMHALTVRPVDDGYEIVSGHHRHEAAVRAKLKAVPCWVEPMSDEDAYDALLQYNNQGELTRIEKAIHCFEEVGPIDPTRRSKKLAEYCQRHSITQPEGQRLNWCGNVISVVFDKERRRSLSVNLNASSPDAFRAVSQLPISLWPDLANGILENEWSVRDTEAVVEKVKGFLERLDVPERWEAWLPREPLALAVGLGNLEPGDVSRLIRTADEVLEKLNLEVERLREAQEARGPALRLEVPDLGEQWVSWLEENTGKSSWNLRSLRTKRDQLEDQLAEFEVEQEEQVEGFTLHHSDFRLVALPDESVDVIITDPPYPKEFLEVYAGLGEFAARVLKPGGSLIAMVGQSYLDQIMAMLGEHLTYHWQCAYMTKGTASVQMWDRKVLCDWKPLLWFTKGKATPDEWVNDVCYPDADDKRFHHWGQAESGMSEIVERFSKPGDLVCDPFLGGGTTGVVSLRLGRQFVGIDIEEKCVTESRKRIEGELKS